jgi:hypothetical protein
MAPLLPGLLKKRGLQWVGGLVLAVFGAVFLIGGILGLAGLPSLVQVAQRYELDPWFWLLLLGAGSAGLLGWLRFDRGMFALVLWLPAYWLIWSTWGYIRLDPWRSPADLMEQVLSITGPGAWLAMPNFQEEFLLQARQPSVHFGRETPSAAQMSRSFAWLRKGPNERWMLIEQRRKDELACAKLEEAKDLGFQNGDLWWLIPGTAFSACAGSEADAPIFVAPTTIAGAPGIVIP